MFRVMWWQNNELIYTICQLQNRKACPTVRTNIQTETAWIAKPQTPCCGWCCHVTHLTVKWHLSVWLSINSVWVAWPNGQSIRHSWELSMSCLSCPFLTPHGYKNLQSCSCRHLQPFAFQHLRALPSKYRMWEVSTARNVQKHVYAVVFVCRNRLNHQWVEVAGDLSTLIRNLWSAKMFGLWGGGIGSCRTGRQAGDRRGVLTIRRAETVEIQYSCLKYLQ